MIESVVVRISKSLGVEGSQLKRMVSRAPHTYKTYDIPKKTGGFRRISQPARETKFIQYWLIDNIFNNLPIHNCVTAYMPKKGIKINAEAHKKNNYFAKLDFRDFFSSIKAKDLVFHLIKYGKNLSIEDIKIISRLSCIIYEDGSNPCLSIGAPSSPIISNSVMFDFDEKLSAWCLEKKIIYTRYADDMTFSTNEEGISNNIKEKVESILCEIEYPKLLLNEAKTIHLSKKYQVRITGLIINNQNSVSLGRERKRLIRTIIHKFTLNNLSVSDTLKLQGLLSFANDIEPSFLNAMKNKYGEATIERLLKFKEIK